MSSATKDTIYIDIDDEITTIIDKVLGSKEKIVALVLPKRASVLQSIVNMKLLKRTADQNKKQIVLITSEAGLLPLAGAVGLYVAKTLQTKPGLPSAPGDGNAIIAINEDDVPTDTDLDDIDPERSIGELAGLPALALQDEEETIDIDGGIDEVEAATPVAAVAKGNKKANKRLKVPNFEAFRVRLLLGGLALVLLLVGWYWAYFIAPKATVVIKTETSTVAVSLDLTARPNLDKVDTEKNIVPSLAKDFKKTDSLKVPTTGQKDTGTRASGTVSLKNCSSTDGAVTIPAGTGVSTGNFTFITQADTVLPASLFSGSHTCITSAQDAKVTAQNAGDTYNLSNGRAFAVNGYSGVTGTNGASMSGGTTVVVKVVAQSDLDGAKQKIQDQDQQAAADELAKQLEASGYLALKETIAATGATATSTPNVGDEASEATVNVTVTYTMVGLKKDDLKQLVTKSVQTQIDTTKQTIVDDGLGKAVIRVGTKEANGDVRLNLQTSAATGAQLDLDGLKKSIAGKKRGDAENFIKSFPGVKDVQISYKPFWVVAAPKKISKITVTIEKSENASSPQ